LANSPRSRSGEVVHVHSFRFAGEAPFGASVGVVADEFLPLVSALIASWPPSKKVLGRIVQIAELGLAVGLLGAPGHRGVGLQ